LNERLFDALLRDAVVGLDEEHRSRLTALLGTMGDRRPPFSSGIVRFIAITQLSIPEHDGFGSLALAAHEPLWAIPSSCWAVDQNALNRRRPKSAPSLTISLTIGYIEEAKPA
jgi:hypothetical protein